MLKISKRWKKIIGYSLGTLIVLLLALWGVLYWYVNTHKAELIAKIEQTASDKIEGKVIIKDIQPDLFKSFPMISFRLDSISLQDSLFHIYKTKLIELEHAYARLNFFSVIKGSPEFSKITIENGAFNIFIDSNGYSNNYLLKAKDSTEKKDKSKNNSMEISEFEVRNFSFYIDNKPMDKKFDFTIKQMDGDLTHEEKGKMNISFDIEAHFKQLGFNLDKGSFLKNAQLKTHFNIDFDQVAKVFTVHKTILDLDGEKVGYEAKVVMNEAEKIPFKMVFDAPKVNFNVGINWVAENIYKRLSKLTFAQPLSVSAHLVGGFADRTNPHIVLRYKTRDNKVNLFDYDLEKVSFEGRFDNEVVKNLSRHDSNSVITLDTLSADFSGLPIRARNVSLSNLRNPFAKAELAAKFDVRVLNNIFDQQFTFSKGTASYDLKYNGELFLNTIIADRIYGMVQLDNFDFVYNERNLKFTRGTARLRFEGNDLHFDKLQIYSNNSDLNITGSSKDFLTAFMELPGKAQMDLKLVSNNIDLAAFQTYFVQKRTTRKPQNTGNAIKNASGKLDDFLSNSSVRVAMDIHKATYNKFKIANLHSEMHFKESGIGIEQLKLNHADGTVKLTAGINQQVANNPFFAKVDVRKVKVDKFLYAMNSFGFKGLTQDNVTGTFSVNGDIKGNITDRGVLLERTLTGKLNYELRNAALKNFGFFDKVKKVVPRRRLDNVEIEDLSGTLTVNNGIITIPPTTLETSALNLSFAGQYGLSAGRSTALDLRVPLRNPQIDKRRVAQGKSKRKGEGIVLNFKATSDENGKINIGVGKTENARKDGVDWSEEDEEEE